MTCRSQSLIVLAIRFHIYSPISDPLPDPDCIIAQLLQSLLRELPDADLGLWVDLAEREWIEVGN